jgi:hypothetical protein
MDCPNLIAEYENQPKETKKEKEYSIEKVF